ncbi:hypothetical protein COCC4DRAFT_39166 [Bipolaris maydis ATCC 48331]|nr:uncharacterized protein COCC4DRAFT_39166 [Bipolaris maydis ATCC 48331]KAJ5023155.1 hypothetical protein J3E73DRAFT_238417 [Bipolaris maydis]ENI06775.1 hypothetical protein COCC4DRAFT_39166 [Bipolaris maydis ATCC 48331]KAJ5056094.1 hypothetical protein J3E74DRAFT_421866 [Bipolaris maydis]KAJ6193843.1 hypothetical protein J3E72DRAFT_388577 [Bipolaris maydis]KAJ6267055.1 hypothetical protein PSV08DRAFT_229666 [Bipolaris maydis]
MVLVTRFWLPKHPKHDASQEDKLTTDKKPVQQTQVTPISISLKRLFLPKQDSAKGPWVPNISAVVKAADEGLISSALFTSLQEEDGQIPLTALYQAFEKEIRARYPLERYPYATDVAKGHALTRKPSGALGRSKSVSGTSRSEASLKMQRKSMDLSMTELGRARSLVVKKWSSPLVSMRNGLPSDGSRQTGKKTWAKDGQKAKVEKGRTVITITPAELTALAIMLGSEPKHNVDKTVLVSETGAYNISIVPMKAGGSKYHITLQQTKRNKCQWHAQDSGVSPLFAKHLAAGSLPFTQDAQNTHSILITPSTLEAIQAGSPLTSHANPTPTKQTTLLSSLPSSLPPKFYLLTPSNSLQPPTTLLNAIAALPFSRGLAPLASTPLIKTISFIATGGIAPGKLLPRLEALVAKLHHHSPHLSLFGALYEQRNAKSLHRERERLRRLGVDPTTPDSRADKAARMSRYVALLERLMALVPDAKPSEVLKKVEEGVRSEIADAYARATGSMSRSGSTTSASATATTAPAAQPAAQLAVPAAKSENPDRRLRRLSNRLSFVSRASTGSSASFGSDDGVGGDLGKQLERVLKAELPLDVRTVAFVARMVIVAWTLSVDSVAFEAENGESEDGEYKIPDFTGWDRITMSTVLISAVLQLIII